MTAPVPPEAVTAALKAAPGRHISLGHWEPMCSRAEMGRILEAAAPHILAAERKRITEAAEALRAAARRFAAVVDEPLLAAGFQAQEEALSAVLHLIGDDR